MGVGVIDEFELVSGLIESGSNPDIVSLSSVSDVTKAVPFSTNSQDNDNYRRHADCDVWFDSGTPDIRFRDQAVYNDVTFRTWVAQFNSTRVRVQQATYSIGSGVNEDNITGLTAVDQSRTFVVGYHYDPSV